MLKKRIIFTLLYSDGYFVQSRNFNLQKVGDVKWLEKNYDFKKISYYIDELLVIDISRREKKLNQFLKNVNLITKFSFMPISIGGGINSLEQAKTILSSGADKILLNSNINAKLVKDISKIYDNTPLIINPLLLNDKYKLIVKCDIMIKKCDVLQKCVNVCEINVKFC